VGEPRVMTEHRLSHSTEGRTESALFIRFVDGSGYIEVNGQASVCNDTGGPDDWRTGWDWLMRAGFTVVGAAQDAEQVTAPTAMKFVDSNSIFGTVAAGEFERSATEGLRVASVAAWYMRLVPGHHGALDRLGGLPSHLPTAVPSNTEGRPLRFLAQFACGEHLPLPAGYLHLYQDDPEYDPLPVAVLVPAGAPENIGGAGELQAGVLPFDVAWDRRNDPTEANDEDVELTASKAGGTCYFLDALLPGERLLLQVRQFPAGFNFGGYTAVVAVGKGSELRVCLG
jgi:hypothetical protein